MYIAGLNKFTTVCGFILGRNILSRLMYYSLIKKAKVAPNKLKTTGTSFIELGIIGGNTIPTTTSLAIYPTKMLPKANKNRGSVIFQEDS